MSDIGAGHLGRSEPFYPKSSAQFTSYGGSEGSTSPPPTCQVRMRSPWALLLYLLVITEGWGQEPASPGCHLYPFNVTVRSDRQGTCQGSHVAQACVGHCESSAFPSRYSVLVASGYRHNITSISQCCTISSLRKVKVQLQCGGTRREELEFYTARACQCDMCRLSRY
ncbi:glycoprotein hormone alpha-2 [Ochotona curzoniae]|uniref:glycoprotein hormone alpha-2 n=1 Tax=Ochotona curzoniae TaxID=130825 RepID=UPI001B34FD2A|nr:glycoprotein hormone alpha-2 [Ochotona curzoniae]